ncbi:MAG: alkaline phosphatase family protein, partial [Peptococcaceae bacterium]|nr:alkaline phosphatase family protein [Peptococcaceae bacterium]
MKEKALAQKILLLGMDGMDPRFTMRMLKKGKMPNVQKLLDKGAASKDLAMLGGHPTITPPMWTTLACGCNANVHGITQFFHKAEDLDAQAYNLDSRLCKAEPLWNVFAEAGWKTLVWHWPGSSWPPTSNSENLYVVDGTSPGSVGMAVNQVDGEFMVGGNVDMKDITYRERA